MHSRGDYQRLAYDDADTASVMGRDCRRVAERMPLVLPAPLTLHDKVKREITVDEAARRLAGALHLHLD